MELKRSGNTNTNTINNNKTHMTWLPFWPLRVAAGGRCAYSTSEREETGATAAESSLLQTHEAEKNSMTCKARSCEVMRGHEM